MSDIPFVPDSALELSFIRASGPGGQHVNKTSSAVQLRCDLKLCPEMPADIRARLRRLSGRRITTDDVIVITAQRLRTQEQNRRDAVERLHELVTQASIRPKVRKTTKPTRASRERRLESKQQRSNVKKGRGGVGGWD
jgi:ribosome-associated protein